MIHMPGMAEFMNHQVSNGVRLEKQQAVIDADRATRRMTAPAGSLPSNVHCLVRIPCHGGQRIEPDRELRSCDRRQPPLESRDAQLVITRTPAENYFVLVTSVTDRLRLLLRFITNPEALIDRGQFDDIR